MESKTTQNSENASQNITTTRQQLQQQQQHIAEGTAGNESVKKLIRPVGTLKGLGKMNPEMLKNLKDVMKTAVAKSKGEIILFYSIF